MPDLLAARSQMGVSLAFHIVFAVIGIAMPLMMVLAERRWQVTGHAIYLDLAKRSEEHTSELQSPYDLVCRLLLEKKKKAKATSEVMRNPSAQTPSPRMTDQRLVF